MVTADLRQEAQVRHMMMGAGKTSVVTPICTIESFYTDSRQAYVVSGHRAASRLGEADLSYASNRAQPLQLVPVNLHLGFSNVTQCVNIMNDTVCKILLVTRADPGSQNPALSTIPVYSMRSTPWSTHDKRLGTCLPRAILAMRSANQ
jgi:hypothetical protein